VIVLGVIPARLQSHRLPRKVLRDIAGKPLVVRVYEAAKRSAHLTDLLVATDSQEVVAVCSAYGVPAVVTAETHQSGTDRVWEVAQGRAADVYVNIQGDEPLITPGHIEGLVRPFIERPETQVTTLKIRATKAEEANPNSPKVVCSASGQALYFSRSPIPFDRDNVGTVRYKHLGLYAFRKSALDRFHALPVSTLEGIERLEQLRFLENDIPIVVTETTDPTIGIDTEEDVRALEALLATRVRTD
jgi:3-deoxy-manno-octulosonate cytidylyltransferase (CMP-KDO synthetase)